MVEGGAGGGKRSVKRGGKRVGALTPPKSGLRLLELFCGTKSVGKMAATLGYTEIISVDILKKFNPNICCNILDFDYRKYPVGYFDYIHASPPCTEFSIAKTVGVRKIVEATELVLKTIEIIEYLKPKFFCIENPVGLLRHQQCMVEYEKYRTTVSYCKYGFQYQKNTDLWTNVPYVPRRCIKGSYCDEKKTTGLHSKSVQQGSSNHKQQKRPVQEGTGFIQQRYAIPLDLLKDLLKIT